MKISHLPSTASLTRPARTARPAAAGEEPTDSVTLSAQQPSLARKAGAAVTAMLGSSLAGGLAAVGGALYVATLIGPVIVGLGKADVGHKRVEEAVWAAQNPLGSMALGSTSMLGSVAREFAAPLTWGMDGCKSGFQAIYNSLI